MSVPKSKSQSATAPEAVSEWPATLDALVDQQFQNMVEIREYLHANPEPSDEEFRTTEYIADRFPQDRFHLKRGPQERGLIVDPVGETTAPRIALRADIDALRMQDKKTVPYCSTNPGVMHACGHDGHTAIVVGAAHALDAAARAGVFPGPVPWRAIFQPAEETSMGAIDMVNAGALESVGAIIGAHVDPARPAGKVAMRDGLLTADCVEIDVHVSGKGGHAARPHESQDPIAAAAQLISTIYLFIPRLTNSNDPVVISFGIIRGGAAQNVIPDDVLIRGTMRTRSIATRRRTMDHLRKLARGIAESSDTTIDLVFREGPPAVYNDAALSRLLREQASGILGPEGVEEIIEPSMGGEDFSNYLDSTPGAMFRLGCGWVDKEPRALHTSDFDLHPETLRVGAKILARAAVAWSLTQGEHRT